MSNVASWVQVRGASTKEGGTRRRCPKEGGTRRRCRRGA